MRVNNLNKIKNALYTNAYMYGVEQSIDMEKYPIIKCKYGEDTFMVDLDTKQMSGGIPNFIPDELNASLNGDEFTCKYITSIGLGDALCGETYGEDAWNKFEGLINANLKEKSDKPRVFMDMDGTLAVWNTGKTMEEVFAPGYFRNLDPIQNIVKLSKYLQEKGFEVFTCSKAWYHAIGDKFGWNREFVPWIDEDHMIFIPIDADKQRFIPDFRESDILIDDYEPNLRNFNGIQIKCITDKNTYNPNYPSIFYDKTPEENYKLLMEALKEKNIIKDNGLEISER